MYGNITPTASLTQMLNYFSTWNAHFLATCKAPTLAVAGHLLYEPSPHQWRGYWIYVYVFAFCCVRFCVRSVWCVVLPVCENATYDPYRRSRRYCCCLHVQNGVLKDIVLQLVREDWYTLSICTCVNTGRTFIIVYNMAIIIFLICTQVVKDTKGMEGTQHSIPLQGHKSCILTAPLPSTHTHTNPHTHICQMCSAIIRSFRLW